MDALAAVIAIAGLYWPFLAGAVALGVIAGWLRDARQGAGEAGDG